GGFPGLPQSESMASQAFTADLGTQDSFGIQQVSWPTGSSGQKVPMRAFSGEAAVNYAANLLKSAVTLNWPGEGPFTPGTIWVDKTMLLEAVPHRIIYLKGDDLYYWEVSPAEFSRSQNLDAFMAGVSSADLWVSFGEAEISFLIGLCTSPFAFSGLFSS